MIKGGLHKVTYSPCQITVDRSAYLSRYFASPNYKHGYKRTVDENYISTAIRLIMTHRITHRITTVIALR